MRFLLFFGVALVLWSASAVIFLALIGTSRRWQWRRRRREIQRACGGGLSAADERFLSEHDIAWDDAP